MELMYIIVALAISVWILTSSKFRKSIGSDFTDSMAISSKSLKDTLSMNQVSNVIDFTEDLDDRGLTLKDSQDIMVDFNELMYGTKPKGTRAKKGASSE